MNIDHERLCDNMRITQNTYFSDMCFVTKTKF